MTFYEAAVEVLRVVGRPLHYKKITEIAIKRGLLSHIGKTPELTMGSLLNQAVRKDDGAASVLRTRPGVFALRNWNIAPARGVSEQDLVRALGLEVEDEADLEVEDVASPVAPVEEVAERAEEAPSGVVEEPERRRRRRRRRRPGVNGEEAEEGSGLLEEDGEGWGGEGAEGFPAEMIVALGESIAQELMGPLEAEVQAFAVEAEEAPLQGDGALWAAEPPLELHGIAQAAWRVLQSAPPRLWGEAELGEVVFGQRMVRFHTLDREAAIRAALVTDNHQRARRGQRALFSNAQAGRWGLTAWGMEEASLQREREIMLLALGLQRDAEEALGGLLRRLNRAGLEHLTLLLLDRLGYRDLKVSKRLGDGGVVFTGRLVRGLSDTRVAVCLAGGERPLGEPQVSSLRGTLHHYAASEGVIIALGEVTREAIEESRATNLARITLLDQAHFVGMLLEEGLGVQSHAVSLSFVDSAFFEALGLVD